MSMNIVFWCVTLTWAETTMSENTQAEIDRDRETPAEWFILCKPHDFLWQLHRIPAGGGVEMATGDNTTSRYKHVTTPNAVSTLIWRPRRRKWGCRELAINVGLTLFPQRNTAYTSSHLGKIFAGHANVDEMSEIRLYRAATSSRKENEANVRISLYWSWNVLNRGM